MYSIAIVSDEAERILLSGIGTDLVIEALALITSLSIIIFLD